MADQQKMICHDARTDADAEPDIDQIAASRAFPEPVFRTNRRDLCRYRVDRVSDPFRNRMNGDVGSEPHSEIAAGNDESVFRIHVS